jgi:Flp pilus assembly protein TadD
MCAAIRASSATSTQLEDRLRYRDAGASDATPAAELDEEGRARLASLGYLAGASLAPASAPPGGRTPKDPKEAVELFQSFERAHWALMAGRLAEAHATLADLVRAEPENAVFLSKLAEVERRSGAPVQAAATLRRALAVAPDDNDAAYNLAMALQEAGQAEAAFAALTEAVRRDSGRPEAHNALGITLSFRGDLVGAEREFGRTLELDPNNARASNNLGNVLRAQGRLEPAVAAYQRAAELDPRYADPLNGLGSLAVERDRPRDAIGFFDRALALAPEQHEARFNRALALHLAGETRAAIDAFDDFLERTSDDSQYLDQRRVATALRERLRTGAPRSQGPRRQRR